MQKLTLILPLINRIAVFSFPGYLLCLLVIAEVPLLEILKAVAIVSFHPGLNWFSRSCVRGLDYNFRGVPVACPRLLSTYEWTPATKLTAMRTGI